MRFDFVRQWNGFMRRAAQLRLSANARSVYMVLLDGYKAAAARSGWRFPSMIVMSGWELMDLAGIDNFSALSRAVRSLETVGLIEHVRGQKGRRASFSLEPLSGSDPESDPESDRASGSASGHASGRASGQASDAASDRASGPRDDTYSSSVACIYPLEREKEREARARVREGEIPTVEEAASLVAAEGLQVDAQRWWQFCQARGWRIHGEPIADWRAYLRSWHNNGIQDRPARGSPGTAGGKRVAEQSYTQREYTDEQLESLFAEI